MLARELKEVLFDTRRQSTKNIVIISTLFVSNDVIVINFIF